MSGLEVVGVALGALPVAILALRYYKRLLSNTRSAQNGLKFLIQNLETEEIRLRTTCELLLQGIVPSSELDILTNTSFTEKWKKYDQQLRLRLWAAYGKVQEQAKEMREAVQELHRMLGIPEDGKIKTKIPDKTSLWRELKQMASFTLKKDDYTNVITRIGRCNSVLEHLTGQNCRNDAGRRGRSQGRFVRLFRKLSQNLFKAVGNASTCCCQPSHSICLELASRDMVVLPEDIEPDYEVFKKFRFHVVFGSHDASDDDFSKEISSLIQNCLLATRWESLDIQIQHSADHKAPQTASTSPLPSATSRQPTSKLKWGPSSFAYSSESTASTTQTLVRASNKLALAPTMTLASEFEPVESFCRVVSRQKGRAASCYGYVTEADHKFGVYPPQNKLDFSEAVTLRYVLEASGPHKDFKFSYSDKIRAALAISAGILHLYSTSWLPQTLTLDDFIFLREQDASNEFGYSASFLSRPFIGMDVLEKSGAKCVQTTNTSRSINMATLSLGALLIQLMLGKVDQALDITDLQELDSALAKREAGIQLSGEILGEGGENYFAAVDWCLRSVLRTSGLGNGTFCDKFHAEVVRRLEEDVRALDEDTLMHDDDY